MSQRARSSWCPPEEYVESPGREEDFLSVGSSVGTDHRAVVIRGKSRGRPSYENRLPGDEDRSDVGLAMLRCHAYQDGVRWAVRGYCHPKVRDGVPRRFLVDWDRGFAAAGGVMDSRVVARRKARVAGEAQRAAQRKAASAFWASLSA